MPQLPLAKPHEIGFDAARMRRVAELLDKWVATDQLPAAGVCIGRKGKILEPIFVGRSRPELDAPPLKSDALFLVASLTKPVTVAATMLLVERGLISLDDRVAAIIPKFAANGKQEVRLRHLMTHTSGLPDMPPNNQQLRKEQRPLSDFVEATCRLSLLFDPATQVSYQSMGTAMLGEVVHQVSGMTLPEFLRRELFEPLAMTDTSLGWDLAKKERITTVRLPKGATIHEIVWNTPYWLGFGAPWGGLITSPADYAQLCQLMLNGGQLAGVRILSPATVRAMASNQLEGLPRISEEERRCRPWGLGWRLNWPGHSSNFGDLLGPRSFGHWGSTGTLCWIDPDAEAFVVMLTTQPQDPEGRFLARLSNAICAAMV
jgi:CubicO group peptidase (beta-lactamase class C family)